MSGQIKVTSFLALEELEAAIGRFSSRTIEALEAAERQIARKRDLLDQIVNDRNGAVVYWRQAYAGADPEDDDVSTISYRLQQAEDDLLNAKRWRARVEDSYRSYSTRARSCAYLCDAHSAKARAILKQKIKELYDYAGLQPDLIDGTVSGQTSVSPGRIDSHPNQSTMSKEGESYTTHRGEIHELNYRNYMDQVLLKNIEFKEASEKYVKIVDIRALENGDHEWNDDNEHFWRHHGNAPEFYDSMPSKYRAVRERLAGGETLEHLKLDEELRPGVEFWWSKSDPVRLTHFQGSYFVEQGFHRVTLAKRESLGEIPCSVAEACLKNPVNK